MARWFNRNASSSKGKLIIKSVGPKRTEIYLIPSRDTLSQSKLDPVDVGPLLRQFLTRADDFFGDLFRLTLCDKLIRRQVPE